MWVVAWGAVVMVAQLTGVTINDVEKFPTEQACKDYVEANKTRMEDYVRGMFHVSLTAFSAVKGNCAVDGKPA